MENAHESQYWRFDFSLVPQPRSRNLHNFAFHSPWFPVVSVVCFWLAITVLLDLGGRQWDIVGH